MKKNYALDGFKAIAAFMVVCLHTTYPQGIAGEYIRALARIAVPFFFLISGYFSYRAQNSPADDRKAYIRKVKKHLTLCILLTVVYLLVYTALNFAGGRDPLATVRTVLSPKWLLLNYGAFGFMWFLRALLYVDILLILAGKWIKRLNLKWMLLAIWIVDVVFFKYSRLLFGFEIPEPLREILTKYLCTTLLYYFSGWEIRKAVDAGKKLPGRATVPGILLILACAAGNLIEHHLLEARGANVEAVNYVFTFFLTLAIFLFLLQRPEFMKDTLLYKIGAGLSMYIYYWHCLLIRVNQAAINFVGFAKQWVDNPIFVYIQVILLILLYQLIRKRLKRA